ncbi:MAG: branched-chain amino acid ABC transporter permease [Candidatus Eisenbacteria bacterium]|nr:branched-chain amino acid ABC transporter permease [Candidatus Eisenbacteria bacterium]
MRSQTIRAVKFLGCLLALYLMNAIFPVALNPYIFQMIILSGVNIILAVSLNLVNGFTGQFSIGHAGFMAIGGYLSSAVTYYKGQSIVNLLVALGIPHGGAITILLLIALVLGGLFSAFAGLLVGLPSLRLRGDYLAIVTLGFGEIIRVCILNINVVGGARGFTDIPKLTNFFWVYFWVLLTVVTVWNIMSSSHGRAFLAVREDEIAAEALGINTTKYKVTAFVIGAFFAGVSGGLFAHYLQYLHTNSFTFMKSIEVIVMIVLGGLGSITGSVLAAIFLTILPEVLRPVKEFRMVIYSFFLIVLMITRPQGIFGMRELTLSWIREKLFFRKKPVHIDSN